MLIPIKQNLLELRLKNGTFLKMRLLLLLMALMISNYLIFAILGIAYRAQDIVKDLATISLEEKDLAKIIPIINQHYSMKLPLPISS